MKYNQFENFDGRKWITVQTPANDSFIISVVKQIFLFILVTGFLTFLFSMEGIVNWLMGM